MFRKIVSIGILLMLCGVLFGAISLSVINASGGENVLTWSFTMGVCGGSDGILTVFAPSANTSGAATVTGITYNAVALTHVAALDITTGNSRFFVYRLLNPPSGAHNIVISVSGGDWFPSAAGFCGVDQTTPILNTATIPSTGVGFANPFINVTATTTNTVLVAGLINTGFVSPFSAENCTSGVIGSVVNVEGNIFATGVCGIQAAAGVSNYNWTTGTGDWATLGFTLQPATGAPITMVPRKSAGWVGH